MFKIDTHDATAYGTAIMGWHRGHTVVIVGAKTARMTKARKDAAVRVLVDAAYGSGHPSLSETDLSAHYSRFFGKDTNLVLKYETVTNLDNPADVRETVAYTHDMGGGDISADMFTLVTWN